jgi:hypothetical protein
MSTGVPDGGEPRTQPLPISESGLPSASQPGWYPSARPDLDQFAGDTLTTAEPADESVGDPAAELDADEGEQSKDWRWVEEWRTGREPVPWGPGVTVAGFTAFLVASAVYVLTAGLADQPIIAIVVDVVVAAGITPAIWLARGVPVLRWVAGGAAVGVLIAWISALVFLV